MQNTALSLNNATLYHSTHSQPRSHTNLSTFPLSAKSINHFAHSEFVWTDGYASASKRLVFPRLSGLFVRHRANDVYKFLFCLCGVVMARAVCLFDSYDGQIVETRAGCLCHRNDCACHCLRCLLFVITNQPRWRVVSNGCGM